MENKIKNLIVGQTFKNYPALCEFLKEPEKKGKSRILQLKNWTHYFKYVTHGHKFIIEEIYEEPMPKIDNRGKSEGSRNNNMPYGKYIDPALINYFKKQVKQKVIPLFRTTNQLAQIAGMINRNYSTAFSNKSKYFQYAFSELGEKVNIKATWDVFSYIKSSINSSIRSSLKRLMDKGLIKFEEAYLLVHTYKTRIATDIENNIIKKIEDEVLKDMGLPNRNELQYNDKKRNKYYRNVEKIVKQKIDYVDTLFTGYKIIMQDAINNYEDKKEDKDILNAIFIRTTKEKIEKNKAKYHKEHSFFGKPSSDEYVKERLNENYIIHAEYVIKSLCSYEYTDIREKILNQIVEYNNNNTKTEAINKFIENELDEDKEFWESVLN